jgi:hypothetical protein
MEKGYNEATGRENEIKEDEPRGRCVEVDVR